ncbi:glycine--tRNA ligase subunit alpha [Shigella flexneri]
MEVGAGTSSPNDLSARAGLEPMAAAYVQPSRRPTDGRYEAQLFTALLSFQVVIKSSPESIQSCASVSLKAWTRLFRRTSVSWKMTGKTELWGAWGLGWEVWLCSVEWSAVHLLPAGWWSGV